MEIGAVEQQPAPQPGAPSQMDFSEADMHAALRRSLRNVSVGAAIGIPVIWIAWGWPSMLLFVVGAAIAGTGILEWRRIVSLILDRLNAGEIPAAGKSGPAWRVILWFVLRLALAAVVLYVSLEKLDGRVAALIAGLALAVVALLIEAIRLFYSWSM